MTAEERGMIREGVIRHSIEGGEDFGETVKKLLPSLPGRSFREILNHVDRTWRRERRRRGEP